MIPIKRLTVAFLGLKTALIGILLLVPQQYDTSSQLLFPAESSNTIVRYLLLAIEKLTIWDSVYFTAIASRGHYYEQEWAFGVLWPLIIRYTTLYLVDPITSLLGVSSSLYSVAFASILIANLSHYLASIVLYLLTVNMYGDRRLAEVTALLFIFSPAGVFLLAGYTEPLFALLSFTGLLLRSRGYHIIAGAAFAFSCGIRGNGLFWGVLFLWDLYRAILRVRIYQSIRIIIGGLLIGLAIAGIQYYPYSIYCPQRGEWCNDTLPSIFNYVQAKYWSVGLFKYWTPNNIPNFLFALPMMIVIYQSTVHFCKSPKVNIILPELVVQVIVGLSALFIFNVQIINRISTCLPTVYWYVAEIYLKGTTHARLIIRFYIIWILVQAVLFASFLPPA